MKNKLLNYLSQNLGEEIEIIDIIEDSGINHMHYDARKKETVKFNSQNGTWTIYTKLSGSPSYWNIYKDEGFSLKQIINTCIFDIEYALSYVGIDDNKVYIMNEKV